MKPQEEVLDKWINIYNFPLDVIFKACDICFQRINKGDFRYIDGILNSWHKEGLKTLQDVTLKDNNKKHTIKKIKIIVLPLKKINLMILNKEIMILKN